MRVIVIILVVVGVVFVSTLLLWPQQAPTNSMPGYRPKPWGWLAALVPPPPAASPFASTPPPSTLPFGGTWTGKFTADNKELGTVRVHLLSGPSVTVAASEPGQDPQVLCIVAFGARPAGCGDDNMAEGDEGRVVVHKQIATIRIDAPAGAVGIAVND
jgi:hypothetical protein